MPESPTPRRAAAILEALGRAYPDATCSLRYSNPLELLIATLLSAQCTDARVNQVTETLFRKYRTAADYAQAPPSELEKAVNRVNFYRNKARFIQRTCALLVERFGGQVPRTMDELLQLPGVARKTANVVLGNAFGIASGIVVDTHMMRLSRRLELSASDDRNTIERDLMRLIPHNQWTRFAHQMIQHGRAICRAREPRCAVCPIGKALCPSYKEADGKTRVTSSRPKPGRNPRTSRG